jgi:lysophospholipase L1-like esterase
VWNDSCNNRRAVTLTSPSPRPWFQRALLITLVAVLLLIAKDWAYVPTFRLFLDQPSASGGARSGQQFGIEGDRVVPTIVSRGADRVAFATEIGQNATIHVDLRSDVRVTYAIEWQQGLATRVLAQGTVDRPASIVCDYPTGTGVIAFVSDGPVTWVDPRIVRNLPLAPYVWAAGLLVLCALASRGSNAGEAATLLGFSQLSILKAGALTASLAISLLVSEGVLRAIGDRMPSGIAAERHDLGEANRDPHWVDSPRYGRRLRAGVETLNEWREGDIVRMGYVPPPPTPGPLHRFSFRTDAEGFRNPSVRADFEIAALGDSFTDAMTMAGEASWPSRLESLLGVPVQNYGTAGFGPQQELLVLKDYVASHRPRTVVLAFFSGNDLFDAEAFDAFQRSGGAVKRAQQGWRIKDVISRGDRWFLVSALRAGRRVFGAHQGAVAAAEPEPAPVAEPPSAEGASFDEGWFDVEVAGRRMRWAFMPPYLNTLNFSKADLGARPGWRLTSDAIKEMQAVSRSFGAEFVVMFVPFKSQVYMPLVEGALSRPTIESAFRYYLKTYGGTVDLDRMLANRLAQNEMIADLCATAGIPFLDTTPALAARAATGENVYFPDESHLNQAGEALIAEELAAFLRARQALR